MCIIKCLLEKGLKAICLWHLGLTLDKNLVVVVVAVVVVVVVVYCSFYMMCNDTFFVLLTFSVTQQI